MHTLLKELHALLLSASGWYTKILEDAIITQITICNNQCLIEITWGFPKESLEYSSIITTKKG